MRITHLSLIPLSWAILCCQEKPQTGQKAPPSRETGIAAHSADGSQFGHLRNQLCTPNGSQAYAELHHSGKQGFEILLSALTAGDISPDDYISWEYDLATRWPDDGQTRSDEFKSYQFQQAEANKGVTTGLASFYSRFPTDYLDKLKEEGPGAARVVNLATGNK